MAVRFRPFTGTSRGFPSADDVGGRRQESDVTELDRTGDPDSAGRHAAPGGDGGAEGHTQVISTADVVGPGPVPETDSPTVRVPAQAGPPRPGPAVVSPGYGPVSGVPATARKASATPGGPAIPRPATPYDTRSAYGAPPGHGAPTNGAPAAYGNAPAGYGAGPRPAWGTYPAAAPAGHPPPGAYPAPPTGTPGAAATVRFASRGDGNAPRYCPTVPIQ